MKVTVLGTGTSTGVPIPGCACSVCTSPDPRNTRLRCSIHIELPRPGGGAPFSLLIDTSTDLRQQVLRWHISRIDAVLFTHAHADHVHGIDDLRSFNFIQRSAIPVYASDACAEELERKFAYCFHPQSGYEGGAPPKLLLHRLDTSRPLVLPGFEILPLPVLHGTMEVLGFRIGRFAYVTDCSTIPQATRERLYDLDVLILDALRERPHSTHFTLAEAVAEIAELSPKRAYLTHMSHEVDYLHANEHVRQMSTIPVELAYDGLKIRL